MIKLYSKLYSDKEILSLYFYTRN